jgi:hypothetical protein
MAGSGKGKSPKKTLEVEVREALLLILRDSSAPATARASAARSLVLMLGAQGANTPDAQREASGMTIEELDDEIASLENSGNQQRVR